MRLWIAGKTLGITEDSWEFTGVFSTEGKAIDACKDHTYFIGPASLDSKTPDEQIEWPGAYYPIKEKS